VLAIRSFYWSESLDRERLKRKAKDAFVAFEAVVFALQAQDVVAGYSRLKHLPFNEIELARRE